MSHRVLSTHGTPKQAWRGWAIVSIVVMAATLSACGSSSKTAKTAVKSVGTTSGSITSVLFSAPKGDHLVTRGSAGGSIVASAPASNTPGLLIGKTKVDDRFWASQLSGAFWPQPQPLRADQKICVTMHSVIDASTTTKQRAYVANPKQVNLPGVALRIAAEPHGKGTRAIVIRQNLKGGAMWAFRVLAVRVSDDGDTTTAQTVALGSGDVKAQVGQPGKSETTATMKPPPWHLCAKAVGTKLSFMVWAGNDPQPDWSDKSAVHEVTLPSNWVYQGNAGGYVALLQPGISARFSDIRVTSPY